MAQFIRDDRDDVIYQYLFNFPYFCTSIFKCNRFEFVLSETILNLTKIMEMSINIYNIKYVNF
jgi:hypothetical protein